MKSLKTMRYVLLFNMVLVIALVSPRLNAQGAVPGAQGRPQENGIGRAAGDWVVPASSVERAEDAGKRAHTNIVLPLGFRGGRTPAEAMQGGDSPSFTYNGETPQSLGCLYQIPGNKGNNTGCVPLYTAGSGGPQSGGWGIIGIVDAYNNPHAVTDLQTFDSYWGLPAANFSVVYANGNGDCTTPVNNSGWALESSLDIEYAHAMAPHAKIVLIEACTNSNKDLYYAEDVAGSIVAAAAGGDISNSWGEGEYSGEIADDVHFGLTYWQNIAYFASAGDSGCGAAYPSSSPWVVSAGGSEVVRNSVGQETSEKCWAGSGGGTSTVETYTANFTGGNTGPWADFQYPIFGQANRATPDFASDASNHSPVWIYSAYGCGGWCLVAGTSVASPTLAGIVNTAANKLGTATLFPINSNGYYTNQENNLLYSELVGGKYSSNFYDVKTGSNGCSVTASWDYCTGVGTPRGIIGK
jgi:kumamolisin